MATDETWERPTPIGQPPCDFCTLRPVTVQYTCDPIRYAIGNTVGMYPPDWYACDECATLIDSNHLDDLVKRIINIVKTAKGPAYLLVLLFTDNKRGSQPYEYHRIVPR